MSCVPVASQVLSIVGQNFFPLQQRFIYNEDIEMVTKTCI